MPQTPLQVFARRHPDPSTGEPLTHDHIAVEMQRRGRKCSAGYIRQIRAGDKYPSYRLAHELATWMREVDPNCDVTPNDLMGIKRQRAA